MSTCIAQKNLWDTSDVWQFLRSLYVDEDTEYGTMGSMRRFLPLFLLLAGCCAPPDTLHDAVKRNDPAAVQALIITGADVDSRDENGLTPLMLACMNLQEQNIRLLIRAGADPQATNPAGTTALHMLNRGDSIPSRAPACRKALQEELDTMKNK